MNIRYPALAYPLITVVFLLQIPGTGKFSFAEETSFDAFQARFQKATGKTWESADPQEKRDFVHQDNKTTAEAPIKAKIEPLVSGEQSFNLKREATVQVRKQFLKENGKPWEEGTEEEQEAFLNEYRKLKSKEAKLEEQKKRHEEALEMGKERQKAANSRAIQRAQRAKEKQESDEARVREKKKKAEKKKLEEIQKKIKEKHKKMQRKHR